MAALDIVMLVAYFTLVAAVGFWSSRRSQESTESYFLSSRTVGWFAIGASLFSANVSAEHFIGLASSGSNSGLAVGQFEWLACFVLLLLGWLFVPVYLRLGVFTMPEFLETRYSPACRTYLSAVSLIAYVFTKISVSLWAAALVLKTILGWSEWTGAIVLLVATGIYTIVGGLRAVIYTEVFQAFVLIAGGVILTFATLDQVGGVNAMMAGVDVGFFNLWKPMSHPDFPWTGILFGAPILGIWYWCTDQMIVQRTLAARSIEQAQRGTIFAGFLKLLPVFILVLPGVAGRVLYPDVKPDHMYAELVNRLLPVGVKGLVVACLLAALMSSLSAVFNSSSTLVVMDFYKKWRPQAAEREAVRAGQVATGILVVSGLFWLPFIGKMSEQLYVYLQSVQGYISPPIAAVFLLGLLWRGANSKGALSALLVGFVLGAARFITEVFAKLDLADARAFETIGGVAPVARITSPLLKSLAAINFLHFAIILFVVSVAVLVGVSLATGRPAEDRLLLLSRSRAAQMPVARHEGGRGMNLLLSAVLVVIVLGMWAWFSPLFFRSTNP